jgi:CDP-diacylglycerol--glycerol-3-phosphate 3-phosphatidyltransferase
VVITLSRIVACPVIFLTAQSEDVCLRFSAFVIFLLAALSDALDGYIARRYDLVTDLGKLLDPIADKLLLVSTFVPIFLISNRGFESEHIPFWGALSGWVLIVIFGREALITFFRSWGAKRGVIIAAGKSGKRKTLLQFLFAGGLLLWYPISMLAAAQAWDGVGWVLSRWFFLGWSGITLPLAILMTIYSMLDYLWSYRALVGFKS